MTTRSGSSRHTCSGASSPSSERAVRAVRLAQGGTSTFNTWRFVLGPVYVGVLSVAMGLRGAMVGVAALGAGFALFAPPVTGRSHDHGPQGCRDRVLTEAGQETHMAGTVGRTCRIRPVQVVVPGVSTTIHCDGPVQPSGSNPVVDTQKAGTAL